MLTTGKIAACFFGIVIALTLPQVHGWHGIRPLHATRSDVEKLTGPPMEPRGVSYDLKDERVNVVYANVPCAKGWPYGWNVPPNTVVSIVTYPKTIRTLSDLRIDLSKYKKNERPNTERAIYYNDEDGITLETDSNQHVKSIQYLPASGDYNLRCPDSAAREAAIEKGKSAYLTPELYYFDVSQHEQRVRLGYFADRLSQHAPESLVYIIGYAGKNACPDEALERANRAKQYLVKGRKIPSRRINTVDGGNREDVWVELFIVSSNGPTPLSSPNIYPNGVQNRSKCAGHLNKK